MVTDHRGVRGDTWRWIEEQFQLYRGVVKPILEAGAGEETTSSMCWQGTAHCFPEWSEGASDGISVTYLLICLSVHPPICPSTQLSVHPSIYPLCSPSISPHLSIHLPIHSFDGLNCPSVHICPSNRPSIHLFIYPPVCPTVLLCLSIHRSIQLSIHPPTCLSIHLPTSVHLFVSPSIHSDVQQTFSMLAQD